MTDQQNYDAAERAYRRDRLMSKIIDWSFPLVLIGVIAMLFMLTL